MLQGGEVSLSLCQLLNVVVRASRIMNPVVNSLSSLCISTVVCMTIYLCVHICSGLGKEFLISMPFEQAASWMWMTGTTCDLCNFKDEQKVYTNS